MKTEPLIGKAATKKEFLSRLASIASVLIAAHGNVETGDIVLSTNAYLSRKPKEQVYLLSIEYVLKSKLQAKLVVLSCCQSGRGEIKVEGEVGITGAFLGAAGGLSVLVSLCSGVPLFWCPSVLVSLWALDDDASHEFMKHFYTQLEQSASKSLNLARKSMQESVNFSDV